MRPEDAGEGVTVLSRVGDDALGIVPVDEYETVFSFPTVGKDSVLCVTRSHGFWLTFYVDNARSDSGQGPRANKTKYARSMRAFKVRASKRDPPKFFVSTPPAGSFSHRDIVWQRDVQWPRGKSASKSDWLHAVIPAERLLDFRRGVQRDAATEFSVSSSYKKGRGTSSALVLGETRRVNLNHTVYPYAVPFSHERSLKPHSVKIPYVCVHVHAGECAIGGASAIPDDGRTDRRAMAKKTVKAGMNTTRDGLVDMATVPGTVKTLVRARIDRRSWARCRGRGRVWGIGGIGGIGEGCDG